MYSAKNQYLCNIFKTFKMKIALIGYGKMGRMIEQTARSRGHEIVCIIDVDNQQDFDSEAFVSADVAIEFTTPQAAFGNYLRAFKHNVKVVEALKRVDQAALKLDSAIDATMRLINGPQMPLSVAQIEERMREFGHDFTLQTLFLTGHFNGQVVDNTTPQELEAWLAVVERLHPRDVMIYTIDRETPASDLHKVSLEKLQAIAARVEALGVATQVRG